MIEISKQDNRFIFEVKGMHKLWAFKSQLEIPAEHIIDAHQDFSEISEWRGLKMPGTYVPYLITAGTFYVNGTKIFWDVVNKEKSIIVNVKDENYQQLIIEVENPEDAIKMLTKGKD
jgi:hypothetical protein